MMNARVELMGGSSIRGIDSPVGKASTKVADDLDVSH